MLCFSDGCGPSLSSARELKKGPFCILVGISCQNVPACTPQSGNQRGSEVANTRNIGTMAKTCIKRNSARATPPHTCPMQLGQENSFSAQNCKETKLHDVGLKKSKSRGRLLTIPTTRPLLIPQKVGFNLAGSQVSDQKSFGNVLLRTKKKILHGVEQTIQPLGVGYANRSTKTPKNGGLCAVFPCLRAPLALI